MLARSDSALRARRAAFALAARSDPAALPVLMALALSDRSEEGERLRAIEALAGLPGSGVRQALVSLLADVRLRAPAARALGRLGDRRAVSPLAAALRQERYLPAREAEARALLRLGDRRALVQVRRFLGMDVPMPGGVRLLLEAHALRPPGEADLRRHARAREGAFLCDEIGCMAGDVAALRLPRVRSPARLVLLFRAPEGGGVMRVAGVRHELPAGEHELSVSLEAEAARSLAVRTEGELRILAFALVPAQEEIPPPAPEPWRDAGADASELRASGE
jgi:hypothetical protein